MRLGLGLRYLVAAGWVAACSSDSRKSPPIPFVETESVEVASAASDPSAEASGGGGGTRPSKFLVFDPSHPFTDAFGDGRLFRHWRTGQSTPSIPIEEAGISIQEEGVRMDLMGRESGETMKSLSSAALFPPQSFAQDVEVVMGTDTAGAVGAALLFGPPGGAEPSARVECGLVDPAEIDPSSGSGSGFPTLHYNCSTYPGGGSSKGTGIDFNQAVNRTIVYHTEYDHAGRSFSARVTLKPDGLVLFDSTGVPYELTRPFQVGFLASARRGPITGRESVIRSRWDNYTSNLQVPDGYLISYSPLSYGGTVFDDVLEPYPTKGATITTRFPPEPGATATILGAYTRVPPEIDGTADVNAALVTLPNSIHVTAYMLIRDENEIASLVKTSGADVRLAAFIRSVFRSRGRGKDYE